MQPANTQRFLVVAYTGHRSLANERLVANAAQAALDGLEAVAARRGSTIVLVGSAAKGADVIILEAAQRRSHPNLLKLPFALDRFELAAPPALRAKLERLVRESTAVEYAPPGLTDDEAYLEAGLQTLEPADVLLAVWNGEASRGTGGTAEIIHAAHGVGVPVVHIHAHTGEITWPESFRPPAEPASPRDEADPPFSSNPEPRLGQPRVKALHDALDKEAKRHAPMARLLLFRVIALHLLASAVAIGAMLAHVSHAGELAIGAFKAAALVWALLLATAQHRRSHAWLDARYRAELCRSFLSLWPMRRDALTKLPHPSTSGDMESFHRDLELHWRLCAADAGSLDDARAHYETHRLKSQRDWMSEKGSQAARIKHTLHRVGVLTTIIAILCSAGVLAVSALGLDESVKYWLKGSAMILPLASAAIFSFIVSNDFARRSDRYSELAHQLTQLQRRLAISRTWPTLGRVVAETEALLLNELGEWHAMMRFAGRPH